MLRELKIRNFAIIDTLDIFFEQGLNVLTGETGAGKSIIVDALGVLLGSKIGSEFIKSGRKEASIEAFFENFGHPLLEQLSINCEEGIVLRRQLSLHGKGKSYVNNVYAGSQMLATIGKSLINIHGQNQHHDLLTRENHLYFVDTIGNLMENRHSFNQSFKEVSFYKKTLAEMKKKVEEKNRRVELLKYQISEIDSLKPKAGEKESLEEELNILQNLSKLRETSETIYQILYAGEGSCIDRLSLAIKNAQDLMKIDSNVKDYLDLLNSAYPLLKDAVSILQRLKEKYEVNTNYIDRVIERLDALKRLENKYKKKIEEIIEYQKLAERELSDLETMDEQIEVLQRETERRERECLNLATELSIKRSLVSQKIEEKVVSELKELGFVHSEFKISFNKKDYLDEDGFDDVEFLFSANPGEQLKPLIKIASGGELSRIMLALKCAEIGFSEEIKRDKDNTERKTLIFDEVDAGIGGVTAQNVAKKLKEISKNYQVICITHLPQIAAIADHHLLIKKTFSKEGAKITVEALKSKDREEELARMLSGVISDTSLKHAKELLNTL
ncbi:MAG: DNA repair protein RecN [Thermodesulfovibrionales bacterium]|nr:DNA repair protein RecN [Thermodesulfovibrionales bacterium]